MYQITVEGSTKGTLCSLLAEASGLSKARVKKAMSQGAAWLQRPGKKTRRVRRASMPAKPGDRLVLYYDEKLLSLTPPRAECLVDSSEYSVWYKPAGLLTQGSRYGDHAALTRQVETHFSPPRQVFLVHRIDREASGLVLIAHCRRAASALSSLLRHGGIDKRYQIQVRGKLGDRQQEGSIDLPLDGRPAKSTYQVIGYDPQADQSTLHVRLNTGRRHQIRRHMAMIGHPVMGDPVYGSNNKNQEGLQLAAFSLSFLCPFGRGTVNVRIDPDKPR